MLRSWRLPEKGAFVPEKGAFVPQHCLCLSGKLCCKGVEGVLKEKEPQSGQWARIVACSPGGFVADTVGS